MIEGLLRHQSNLKIEGKYVDSHGQSEIGFAFTELLGYKLLPRPQTHRRPTPLPTSPQEDRTPKASPATSTHPTNQLEDDR